MSRRNAPAFWMMAPTTPDVPRNPSRSPTPALSDQDFDEVEVVAAEDEDEALFFEGDAEDAAARREERRGGAIFYTREIRSCPLSLDRRQRKKKSELVDVVVFSSSSSCSLSTSCLISINQCFVCFRLPRAEQVPSCPPPRATIAKPKPSRSGERPKTRRVDGARPSRGPLKEGNRKGVD